MARRALLHGLERLFNVFQRLCMSYGYWLPFSEGLCIDGIQLNAGTTANNRYVHNLLWIGPPGPQSTGGKYKKQTLKHFKRRSRPSSWPFCLVLPVILPELRHDIRYVSMPPGIFRLMVFDSPLLGQFSKRHSRVLAGGQLHFDDDRNLLVLFWLRIYLWDR